MWNKTDHPIFVMYRQPHPFTTRWGINSISSTSSSDHQQGHICVSIIPAQCLQPWGPPASKLLTALLEGGTSTFVGLNTRGLTEDFVLLDVLFFCPVISWSCRTLHLSKCGVGIPRDINIVVQNYVYLYVWVLLWRVSSFQYRTASIWIIITAATRV